MFGVSRLDPKSLQFSFSLAQSSHRTDGNESMTTVTDVGYIPQLQQQSVYHLFTDFFLFFIFQMIKLTNIRICLLFQ